MGRFYRTARPTFVDDNIYTPPVELMQGVLATHEKRTDDLISQSDLLDGAVDSIQHLNFEAENERVKQLQTKYKESVDGITQKIYENPLEYQKHLPQLKQLQKEMMNDKTSGEWYNIEQRYGDYQNWLKDNEKLRESNPTLFNQLNNHWYSDVVNRGSADSQAKFAGQKIIDKPDLISGYRQHFENIKANASEISDGKYKIGNKWVSEDEVANIAWNTLLSDKNYKGYVNQQGNILGERGFFDDQGNSINAFNLVDGEGKNITFEEYQKLSSEEKKNVKRQLNPNNAFFSDLSSVAETYSFTEQTVEEDKFGLQNNKAGIDSQLEQQKQAGRMQLEAMRQRGDVNNMMLKYQLQDEADKEKFKNDLSLKAAGGDKDANEMLNKLTAKETLGVIGNPNASLENDYNLIESNTEGTNAPNDGKTYVYAAPGTTKYAAQQRRKNASKFATDQIGDTTLKLNNGKEFEAKEYIDWLGDRRHSEETAKEFLEREQSVFQSPSFETSLAEQAANNTRFIPSWLKDDSAKDWDKIYELGNKYEEKRNEWYEDYSTSSQQLSFQPVTDATISRNMLTEVKNNKENFYLTDSNGDIPKKFRDILEKVDGNSQVFVTAANAHNEMGMKVEVEGEDFYIFPNNGNAAASNLMTNLSMMGVDNKSQYFQEMSDRVSSNLLHNLNKVGENTKGNKSIVTKLNGIDLSLELVGDEVHLRQPDQGLNTEPVRTFSNMQEFTKAFFGSQK